MRILYQDNHIIVTVKKAGQPAVPDKSNVYDLLSEIKDYIKREKNKPGDVYLGVVHRLDRPVGGVTVYAKTSKAASRLSDSIRKNEMTKKYLAVVKGNLTTAESGTRLENHLKKNEKTNTSHVCDKNDKDAKYSVLTMHSLRTKQGLTLVRIDLDTGRHHQIRVQLSHAGYPIYGDMKYGGGPKGDIALFASELSFMHPVKNEIMTFKAEPDYSVMPWPLFK